MTSSKIYRSHFFPILQLLNVVVIMAVRSVTNGKMMAKNCEYLDCRMSAVTWNALTSIGVSSHACHRPSRTVSALTTLTGMAGSKITISTGQ